jgi:TolA-binding protein
MKTLQIFVTAIFILLTTQLFAQETGYYKDHMNLFEQGRQLYEAGKYGAAREAFQDYLKQTPNYSEEKVEAEYLRALSAMKMQHKDAKVLLNQFVKDYPEKSRTKRVYYQLALSQFAGRDYYNARKSFEKTPISSLRNEEIVEYYFKYGYAAYKSRDTVTARQAFNESRMSGMGSYAVQANYYYSHLAYEQNDYQEALAGFQQLRDHPVYGNLVGYHIVQILYHLNKPEELIREALPLMETIHVDRKPELAYLIGESYYRLSDYDKAIEYLRYYQENTKKHISREGHYQLAFTLFQLNDYEGAVPGFQKAIDNQSDSLAQNAYYHLGMCYVKTGNKKFAGNAFMNAYKIEGNETLREDALYNYVKLSYESPYNPYNTSVDAVQKFMNAYPYSRHSDEINTFLVDIFLNSEDYASAIDAFQKISRKTEKLKQAYQKITYYYATELFNEKKYFDAIKYYKEANKYDYDKNLSDNAIFWIGEAYYQFRKDDLATKYYELFLNTPGAYNQKNYPTAWYNLGYIAFSKQRYLEAQQWFRKYTIGQKNRSQVLLADAYIRLGDCYFIAKDYDLAISYYDKSIQSNARNMDYAMYQKALAFGGKGEFDKKILQLDRLVRSFPESAFVDKAEYEMGLTYLIQDKNREALKRFKIVYNRYPNSPLVKKSYLKAGVIYYNIDRQDEALKILKEVVEKYPNTPEAHEALSSIKNIYIDMNQADSYFEYANSLNYTSVSATEQDSITYMTAESIYMRGDFEQSIPAFERYLSRYPDGAFAVNAHFYKGQSAYRSKDFQTALKDFRYVAAQPQSGFTETALLKAAEIELNNQQPREALALYSRLALIASKPENRVVAQEGMMVINYDLENFQEAIRAAEKLLKNEETPEEISRKAHLIVARSAFRLNDLSLAKQEFARVIPGQKLEMAAEAKYYLALIAFKDKQYDLAEKTIFEVSESYGAYDYWLAKSFMLLADVYTQTNNLFQAKETLQSIIDNYEGADLVALAQKKKQAILEMEKELERKKIEEAKKAEMDEKNVDNY